MKTVKLSDIIVKYLIECPKCGEDTLIEYHEIMALYCFCEECKEIFDLEPDCEFEILKLKE